MGCCGLLCVLLCCRYVDRHRAGLAAAGMADMMAVEDNSAMRGSYCMLDAQGRCALLLCTCSVQLIESP
jgi:hypothetical protein